MIETYKTQARRLRERLLSEKIILKHSTALEAVAAIHGESSWNILQSKAAPSAETINVDSREGWLRSTYGEQIVALHDDPEAGVTYIAARNNHGGVNAVVCTRVGKAMTEWEGPLPCGAPLALLDALTPARNTAAAQWRASCKITRWRAEDMASDVLSAWVPYSCSAFSVSLPFTPTICVCVSRGSSVFEFSDGCNKERLTLSGEQMHQMLMSLAPMPISSEGGLHDTEARTRAGQSGIHVVILGDVGHEVVCAFSETGGLVDWTAMPIHMGHMMDSYKDASPRNTH